MNPVTRWLNLTDGKYSWLKCNDSLLLESDDASDDDDYQDVDKCKNLNESLKNLMDGEPLEPLDRDHDRTDANFYNNKKIGFPEAWYDTPSDTDDDELLDNFDVVGDLNFNKDNIDLLYDLDKMPFMLG